MGADFVHRFVSAYAELGESNRQTLGKIEWRENASGRRTCDISNVVNDEDPAFVRSEYVVSKRTRYFLFNTGQPPGFWLNFSNVKWIQGFRDPQSVRLETDETWRVYSEPVDVDNRRLEVMVAGVESAPSRPVQCPGGPELDAYLRQEARRIARRVKSTASGIGAEKVASKADGWQIVDTETGRVIRWTDNVPAFFPRT